MTFQVVARLTVSDAQVLSSDPTAYTPPQIHTSLRAWIDGFIDLALEKSGKKQMTGTRSESIIAALPGDNRSRLPKAPGRTLLLEISEEDALAADASLLGGLLTSEGPGIVLARLFDNGIAYDQIVEELPFTVEPTMATRFAAIPHEIERLSPKVRDAVNQCLQPELDSYASSMEQLTSAITSGKLTNGWEIIVPSIAIKQAVNESND